MDENQTMITGKQAAAARALLGWTQTDLAEKAKVGRSSVKSMEAGGNIRSAIRGKIQRAIEAAGVYPQQSDVWGGEGVRFVRNR